MYEITAAFQDVSRAVGLLINVSERAVALTIIFVAALLMAGSMGYVTYVSLKEWLERAKS